MIYRKCYQHLYGIERRRIPPTPPDEMRLHRLERPEPWAEDLRRKMWDMPPNAANHYPDYAPFYARLAEFVGVSPNMLVVGAGIEDFIRTLAFLTCDPGDGMAFTWPTCAMFDIYADVVGARNVKIETQIYHDITGDGICEQIDEGVRLVILPNPGQPIDTAYDLNELRRVASWCHEIGAVLAIDEAYHGFGAPTALPLLKHFDNVLILRTFSKAFGGAALRVGYAIGNYLAIKPLEAARASGEISGPSLHASTVLMDNWATVEIGIADVVAGRNWLRDELRALGFTVRGENANHVLIDMGTSEKAAAVWAALRARGIHVRQNASPLDAHLMVTCGSLSLMKRFFYEFMGVVCNE